MVFFLALLGFLTQERELDGGSDRSVMLVGRALDRGGRRRCGAFLVELTFPSQYN